MKFDETANYLDVAGVKSKNSVPNGTIMRIKEGSPTSWPSEINNFGIGEMTTSGLAMNVVDKGDVYRVIVFAGFQENVSNDQLLTVIALEDNLVHKQSNYISGNDSEKDQYPFWYGESNPVKNYSHQHVAVGFVSSLAGEIIGKSEAMKGMTVRREFEISKNVFSNSKNGSFVAILLDGNQSTVANCQSVKVSEGQKGFE